MTKPKSLWMQLRVGDFVRLVEFPPEFLLPNRGIHRSTRQVYKRLLARRRPLRVYEIDETNLPWIRCQFRRKNGFWEYHYLAINHGGIVRVKHRRKRNQTAS